MRRENGMCIICKQRKDVTDISYIDSGVHAVAIGRSFAFSWHFCKECLQILLSNKRILDKYREWEYILTKN